MSVQRHLHFKGMKQKEIASRLEISQSHFSEMCRGLKPFPLSKVIPLAELLHVPVEDVVRAFAGLLPDSTSN